MELNLIIENMISDHRKIQAEINTEVESIKIKMKRILNRNRTILKKKKELISCIFMKKRGIELHIEKLEIANFKEIVCIERIKLNYSNIKSIKQRRICFINSMSYNLNEKCQKDLNLLGNLTEISEKPEIFDKCKNIVFKTLGYCVGENL